MKFELLPEGRHTLFRDDMIEVDAMVWKPSTWIHWNRKKACGAWRMLDGRLSETDGSWMYVHNRGDVIDATAHKRKTLMMNPCLHNALSIHLDLIHTDCSEGASEQ
jgi:hypothetical protein